MTDDEDVYSISVKCENCGYVRRVEIPRGTPVEDWLHPKGHDVPACVNCGCYRLARARQA